MSFLLSRDDNDASTQTMLEVSVSQGPNLKPPVFQQPVYDAEVRRNTRKNLL
jgi:hypothetical protein